MATQFKNSLVANVGTTPVTVLTTDVAAKTTVIGLSLANLRSDIITVSVQIVDTITADTAYYIRNVIIPNGQSLRVINGGERLVLGPSSEIRIVSNYASSVDVVVSYVEIT